jgi:hypothetical protein
LGSAPIPGAGFGVAPKHAFLKLWIANPGMTQEKFATAGHRRQHAGRVRYPERTKLDDFP